MGTGVTVRVGVGGGGTGIERTREGWFVLEGFSLLLMMGAFIFNLMVTAVTFHESTRLTTECGMGWSFSDCTL